MPLNPLPTHPPSRDGQSLGNILLLEHLNLRHDNQALATLFYVVGLQLTRDPVMMVGLDNMWINVGATQIHLPSWAQGGQQVRGRIELVVPDLAAVRRSLHKVAEPLQHTQFAVTESADDAGPLLLATCPWGNQFVLRQAGGLGFDGLRTPVELGLVGVRFDVPRGAAAGIARFYQQMLGAQPVVSRHALPMMLPQADLLDDGAQSSISGDVDAAMLGLQQVRVPVGLHQALWFVETDAALPPFDGHHLQIYLADFAGPYQRLREAGLITRDRDPHEWRFEQIVDPTTGTCLYQLEHEVRSSAHPLYRRPLINRNPAQTQSGYRPGMDLWRGWE